MSLVDQIGILGFPIAVSVYLLYERTQNDKANREDRSAATIALNKNTEILSGLKTLIEERIEK